MDRCTLRYLVAGIFFFVTSGPLAVRSQTPSVGKSSGALADSPVQFVYQSIDFKLDSDETPEHHAPETMAGGVAVFDYNNDGKLDVFFTNGADMKTLKK